MNPTPAQQIARDRLTAVLKWVVRANKPRRIAQTQSEGDDYGGDAIASAGAGRRTGDYFRVREGISRLDGPHRQDANCHPGGICTVPASPPQAVGITKFDRMMVALFILGLAFVLGNALYANWHPYVIRVCGDLQSVQDYIDYQCWSVMASSCAGTVSIFALVMWLLNGHLGMPPRRAADCSSKTRSKDLDREKS